MSKDFCFYCQEEVEHYNWRIKSVEVAEDEKKTVTICGEHFKPMSSEFIPDRIRKDRKKYFKDTVQPFRDGKISKEFADAYPDQAKKMVSKEELENAQDRWTDVPGHKEFRQEVKG